MEQSTENQKKPAVSNKVVIVAVAVAAVVVAVAVIVVVLVLHKSDGSTASQPIIGYAAEAKVMLDQDSVQAAMDEAMENAKNGSIGLKYKNNAYSTDGVNFTCYIANSESNAYDMFLTIYADAELTDQIFLSGLVPPGSGFENITLDYELEAGDHTVYVALTQVDVNDAGEQVILRQVMHTMDFHVD